MKSPSGAHDIYAPGSGFATGIGLVSPHVGVGYNYSFFVKNPGFRWTRMTLTMMTVSTVLLIIIGTYCLFLPRKIQCLAFKMIEVGFIPKE